MASSPKPAIGLVLKEDSFKKGSQISASLERRASFRNLEPASEGMCVGCSGGDCESCKGNRIAGIDLLAIDLASLDKIVERSQEKTGISESTRHEKSQPEAGEEAWQKSGFRMLENQESIRKWLMHLGLEKYSQRRAQEEEEAWKMIIFGLHAVGLMEEDGAAGGYHYDISPFPAGQRKRERAKIKESGSKTSEEKKRLEALEAEILKKQMELEALRIKNLENALSALECPAGRKSILASLVWKKAHTPKLGSRLLRQMLAISHNRWT